MQIKPQIQGMNAHKFLIKWNYTSLELKVLSFDFFNKSKHFLKQQ